MNILTIVISYITCQNRHLLPPKLPHHPPPPSATCPTDGQNSKQNWSHSNFGVIGVSTKLKNRLFCFDQAWPPELNREEYKTFS